ncbi:MAG TPA: L-arabinose isomerase [Ktedonobacteraceae bacterium]|jgi:L-arabinose isomerase|nr:L-arabinose isomerase [Ktedonobacteraceae bacterium]
MNIDLKQFDVWFVTGSQHLYGPETLEKVAEHAQEIARSLAHSPHIPVNVVVKPVQTGPESIHRLCLEANADDTCVGLITWMHTFSPARMWIAGLGALQKPFAHLHTQYNREIPWSEIDMDFMNLNQSAHGDREFGFITSRMHLRRKVVVGYWQDDDVQSSLGAWARAACAWHDAQGAKIARFGDNMRHVAVTEGDKVEAQIRLGYNVIAHGVGDLVQYVNQVTDAEINQLVREYSEQYEVVPSLRSGGEQHQALREGARIELGLRHFLTDGDYKGFTTNFEDLHGLVQLPGLSVQRLMAENYGFGAEGDWKTAALVRAMKVMSAGLDGGTSFMENYTYHLSQNGMKELGAHMLEICPTITRQKPSLEIHPLSIGGKADPVRLVFDAEPGPAINASVMDMGNRFRLLVNAIDVVPKDEPLPKLPVARALWVPRPDLRTAATAWILAGGAHHTGFSQALTAEHMEDFAEIAGMEFLLIDKNTTVSSFKKELRWNDLYYLLAHGLR